MFLKYFLPSSNKLQGFLQWKDCESLFFLLSLLFMSARFMVQVSIPPSPQERPVHIQEDQLRRKEDATVRRLTRYTQAEHALANSFQRSQQELSTSQLKIQALKRAISLLNVRIVDAREAVQKFRALLADRTIEPREYQSFQQQRWLQERRLLAAEELSRVLQRCLSTVPLSLDQTQTLPCRPSNAKSNRNLAKFLEFSRRRSSRRQNHRYREVKADRMSNLPRIHRHDTLLPLVLPMQRRRSLWTTVTLAPKTRLTVETIPTPPSLCHSEPCLTTYSASPASPLMTISDASISTSSLHSAEATGTATIWREPVELLEEEILKNLVVSIPDYVSDLLAELDSIVPVHSPTLRSPDITCISSENMTSKLPQATFNHNFTPSHSDNTSSDSSLFPTHKSKQRQSIFSSFPESFSSRMNIKSTNNGSNGRATWRFSSPPSSFPASIIPRENVGELATPSLPRRPSLSVSDLRSAFTLSASAPVVAPTTLKPQLSENLSQAQQAKADATFFKRIRRHMSAFRRF